MSDEAKYTIETYFNDQGVSGFQRTSQISSYNAFQYFDSLNDVGRFTFELNMNNPLAIESNFIPKRTQILIKRNGIPLWVGPLRKWNYNYAMGEGNIRFECLSYLSHFRNLFTAQQRIFTNTEASDVAWTLIDEAQAKDGANFKVVQGTLDTIGNIDDTLEYTSVFDAIKNQSDNRIGYDFEMKPTVDADGLLNSIVFNVRNRIGRFNENLTPIKLTDLLNISGTSDPIIYSNITALAQGTGENVLTATAENLSIANAFTRTETVQKPPGTWNFDALQGFADNLLAEQGGLRQDLNLTLNPEKSFNFGSFNVGDTIRLDIFKEDSFINIRGTARIIQKNIQLDSEGAEIITIKVRFI